VRQRAGDLLPARRRALVPGGDEQLGPPRRGDAGDGLVETQQVELPQAATGVQGPAAGEVADHREEHAGLRTEHGEQGAPGAGHPGAHRSAAEATAARVAAAYPSDVTSPLLALPGAVPADGPDAGVAWHYGDPLREQRSLAAAAAWVDRSHRGVLSVTGPERLSWLHSLISQHVAELAEGRATEGLVLDPHGRVEHHLQITHAPGALLLDVEPGTDAALLAWLERMRFWAKVEPGPADLAVFSLAGPRTPAVLAAAGLAVPAGVGDVATTRTGTDEVVARGMGWPGGAVDLLVPRGRLAEVAERLTAAGAAPAGTWAFEALRVAARVPRLGAETDHKTIPHEVGWIGSAVHLQKGCYRGQETVARVQNLGRPPRRLVLLQLDGSDDVLPAHGAPVELAGRPVGFVGTAARHYELGPIALAVVKRQIPDDAPLVVGAVAALIDAA